MFAIVEINGFQYKVKEDDTIKVSKLDCKENEKMEMDKVLFISEDNDTVIGNPYVEGAKIVCHKIKDAKGRKIEIMKFKRRKNYKRIKGHRQDYSVIHIEKIIRP